MKKPPPHEAKPRIRRPYNREGFELDPPPSIDKGVLFMNFQDVVSALLEKLPQGFLFTPPFAYFLQQLVNVFASGSVSQDEQEHMISQLAVHLSRLSPPPQPQPQPQPLNN